MRYPLVSTYHLVGVTLRNLCNPQRPCQLFLSGGLESRVLRARRWSGDARNKKQETRKEGARGSGRRVALALAHVAQLHRLAITIQRLSDQFGEIGIV